MDVEHAVEQVRPICDAVAERGADALREYSQKFDRCVPESFPVSAEAIADNIRDALEALLPFQQRNDDIALLIRKKLQKFDHHVTRCRYAADALIVLGQSTFDLVLLDQLLPPSLLLVRRHLRYVPLPQEQLLRAELWL